MRPGSAGPSLLVVAVVLWAPSSPDRSSVGLHCETPPSGGALLQPPDTLPRTYDAHRASGPIRVDGLLDDEAWRAAAWTDDFVDIRGAGPEPELRTRVKLLWDDRFLYIAAEMEEPHLWATLEERDAIIYRDHDFEVFLDPDGDALRYFELEINALGTVLDLFLERPYRDGGKADIAWGMPGLETGVALDGTINHPADVDQGWTAELAIPWRDLVSPTTSTLPGEARSPSAPTSGSAWKVNFSRVEWPLDIIENGYRRASLPSAAEPHPEANWVWSPQGVIDMHIPERWGVVRFLDASPAGRV